MSKENKTDYFGFFWYAKDFITSLSVITMSMAARGAYISLLSFQGIEASCDLPNDDNALARICGCQLDEWLAVKEHVFKCFIVDGDRVYNERLREERIKINERSAKNRANGLRSAEVRGRKESGAKPTNVERTLNERSTNLQPSSTHNPITTKQKEEGASPETKSGETPSAVAPVAVIGSSIPAVEIYREVFKRFPAKKISPQQQKRQQTETDHDLIVNTVDDVNAEIWREACIEWRDTAAERKHNPLNVEAVIDFYAKALLGEENAPQGNVAQNFGIEGDLR
jgi:uncharacterized protein YdaU (DUF1376 family)